MWRGGRVRGKTRRAEDMAWCAWCEIEMRTARGDVQLTWDVCYCMGKKEIGNESMTSLLYMLLHYPPLFRSYRSFQLLPLVIAAPPLRRIDDVTSHTRSRDTPRGLRLVGFGPFRQRSQTTEYSCSCNLLVPLHPRRRGMTTTATPTQLYRSYIQHLRLIPDPHLWSVLIPRFRSLLAYPKEPGPRTDSSNHAESSAQAAYRELRRARRLKRAHKVGERSTTITRSRLRLRGEVEVECEAV
jgi:hypothetical protein